MQRLIILTTLLMTFVSCSSEQPMDVEKKKKKEFEMYKSSEMASLMRQMHHINTQLKERIQSGEELGEFPESFERILEASMTDNQVMDEFFTSHAQTFLESQRRIYANPDNAKETFNSAVESCLECHRVKCAGPIPKIEKLLIE